MPIYEYVCSKCNEITEKLQGFDDPPLKTCPQCKGRLKKMVSNTSFVLKGGGWYKDGYSSATAPAPKSSGNGKSASTAAKTKTETKKSDSKTDGKSKKAASAAA